MKHLNTLKGLLLTLLLICAGTVSAHDFEVDGIYYSIIDDVNRMVAVTYKGNTSNEYSNEYTDCVVIPKTVTYNNSIYSVTNIEEYAFNYCSDITSITIPSSIMTIGKNAFNQCAEINEVHIEDLAAWCKINFMTTNSNPLCYASELYLNGELLTDLVIPDGITEIKDFSFFGGNCITQITIPSSVVKIGKQAFSGVKFESITIPCCVTRIGNFAFENCSSLREIIFEDGTELLFLGNNKYEDGVGGGLLRYLNIERIYIGRDLYYSTSGNAFGPFTSTGSSWKAILKSAVIGPKVKEIPDQLFWSCPELTNIIFASNPQNISGNIPTNANCHLVLDDNQKVDFDITNTNTFTDVSYTRTISEGKYETIILPFAPDAASLENYAFYALAESGDGYIKFEEVATPVANTPYIYTLREGKENVAITGGETTISSNIVTPEVDGWQTVGSFSNQTIDTSNGNYYALSVTDNEINRITKNLTVLPYRAYFKSVDASKSAFNIYISGTAGIKEISSSEIEGFDNGAIFDLSGRKITEPTKGNIYIRDSKKIMF